MPDPQYAIGGLEARMDEHDKRFDRLEESIDKGFIQVNRRLDLLQGAENRRKGAVGILKILFGGGTLAGLWELAKAVWHK